MLRGALTTQKPWLVGNEFPTWLLYSFVGFVMYLAVVNYYLIFKSIFLSGRVYFEQAFYLT